MKEEIKHFTRIGAAARYNFKPETQNLSSCFRELHNLAQAFMLAKKKNEKIKETFRTHRACCKLQLQA
jgi:hypothetical protein